ncbi:hypothetical protein C0Q88_23400 [Ralstonia pickettii]|uniref:Uncharacterized protein n=1 Tax=Ralstonia pickettii TaxID=329 RepID=A0A2N4TKT2_RALPI|nr:hypothetical protein C0Q88_23400 [Ralstonia pickettii]
MPNCVHVRLTNSHDPRDVRDLESIASAANFLGVSVKSFKSALPRRIGEQVLYRGWRIERLNDLPRRRMPMLELEEQAYFEAMGEAERTVLDRYRRGDPALNDDSVDAAIAEQFLLKYAASLAMAVIDEIRWRASRAQTRRQPRKSRVSPEPSPCVAPAVSAPIIRQRSRPPRT